MLHKKLKLIITYFKLPLIVLLGLFLYLFLNFIDLAQYALILAFILIIIGSFDLFKESYEDLKNKNLGLDYIAILAIIVALITNEYLVGIVIALMLATGRTLEDYGANSAKKTLTELASRIPHDKLVS